MHAHVNTNLLHTPDKLKANPAYAFFVRKLDTIEFLFIGGSHAYGLATKDSDVDLRGFAPNSLQNLLLMSDFEQIEDKRTDTVVYSTDKWIRLLLKNNPAILESFGVQDNLILIDSPFAEKLRQNMDKIISREMAASFGGFARHAEHQLRCHTFMKEQRISKTMRHYVRLLRTCSEALLTGEMHTFRSDREDLFEIGKMVSQTNDGTWHPTETFWKTQENEEKKFQNAKEHAKIRKHMDRKFLEEALLEHNMEVARRCFAQPMN